MKSDDTVFPGGNGKAVSSHLDSFFASEGVITKAHDTILMAESEEELKSLLMK